MTFAALWDTQPKFLFITLTWNHAVQTRWDPLSILYSVHKKGVTPRTRLEVKSTKLFQTAQL